jgi:hypothetical protein
MPRPQSEQASESKSAAIEAAAPNLAASMGGSRAVRQRQSQQLIAGATSTGMAEQGMAAPAPDVIGPPLSIQYKEGTLKGVDGLDGRIAEWERLHLKDGATLTDEERLVLVAHILGLRGISPKKISFLIGTAFFGVTGDPNADNLSENRVNLVYAAPGTAQVLALRNPIPGTARVAFSNGSSTSFTGPTMYQGLDTNDREQRVFLARNSNISPHGNRTSYGGGQSMITANRAQLQSSFLAHDRSKSVRKEVGSSRFNGAFQDFIYDVVLNGYAETVAVQNIPLLEAWVVGNPAPSTMTAAWAQGLGTEAMRLVRGYDNWNVYAKLHTTWFVEDEAAAQILVERVHPGLKVNFDVDAPNNIRIR